MVSGSNKNPPESTTHPPVFKVFLERYLIKYFHELLVKDGNDMNDWKNKFKENEIYDARFVESVTERLEMESKILESIDEFQVLEAFIKVLAMQIYEEESANVRYELKRIKGVSVKLDDKPQDSTGETEMTDSQKPLPNQCSQSGPFIIPPPPPPPPPPLSQFINPPPPLPNPAPLGCVFGSTAPRNPKPSVQAARKLKLSALQQVSSNSIWAAADSGTVKEVENLIPIEEFENLFCEPKDKIISKDLERRKSSVTSNVVCLLDTKRSTNISISLSQLKTFPEIQNLFKKIKNANTDISEDILNALIKCEPSVEEIALVQGYSGDFEMLNVPEKFVLEFSKTPNLAWMIRVLRHMHKIPHWAKEIKDGIIALKDNFWTLRHSQLILKFMISLKRLYELNNVIYGHQKSVQGISFEGILEFAKIHSVKNTKISLLEFLEIHMPEISDRLKESLGNIDKAVIADWDVLAGDLADLKVADRFFFQKPDDLNDSFMNQVRPFFNEWHDEIAKIDGDFVDCRGDWLDLCEYFQEDPESVKPNEFLRIWSELLDQLEVAKNKRLQKK